MCNSMMRKELSNYKHPEGVHTITVVAINALVFHCRDFEIFVDKRLDETNVGEADRPGVLDEVVSSIANQIFNLEGIKGYSHDS